MTKHVVIEAIETKSIGELAYLTYTIKVNGKYHQSYNELSDDYALRNARDEVKRLEKKYERNYTVEIYRGF